MIIYDKAAWHIDAGMSEEIVVKRLKDVFEFLSLNDMLSQEGKEEFEAGIDDSCSLNERSVNQRGNIFLKQYYDEVIKNNPDSIIDELTKKMNE